MGKGLRSQVKKRYRAVRKEVLNETIFKKRDEELAEKMERCIAGENIMPVTPKNRFLFPEDPEASIPQKKIHQCIDMRSESVYNSGYACIGNGRKHVKKEKEEKKKIEIEEAIARRAAIKKAKEMEMEM